MSGERFPGTIKKSQSARGKGEEQGEGEREQKERERERKQKKKRFANLYTGVARLNGTHGKKLSGPWRTSSYGFFNLFLTLVFYFLC